MAILANPEHFEMDRQGEIDQTLVAVRYTGSQRRYSNRAVATQGLWPDYTSFINGIWYVGFVPETVPDGVSAAGVAWFERNQNFEVEYDPAAIAGVLLDRNYLSLEPGGPIGENDVVADFEEKVHDELGLEPPAECGQRYEEQLRDLAGVDEDDDGGNEQVDPEDALVNEFTRGQLSEAVKAVREDTDEFSLRGASMAEMAAYIVEETEDPEATVQGANA